MKFLKDEKVYDSESGTETKIEEDEKVMTISVVVKKEFNGTYCMHCPIWSGDIVGICPLNNKK